RSSESDEDQSGQQRPSPLIQPARSMHRQENINMVLVTLLGVELASGAPSVATPATGATPAPGVPIRMREIFWGGRYGQLHSKIMPFQGEISLQGAELYQALGRPDLVKKYHDGSAAITGVWVAGFLIGIAGLAAAAVGNHQECASALAGRE